MTRPGMAAAIAMVLAADGQNFVRLVELAGLDPRTDFRRTSLAGLSFAGQNLRSFDFSGSNLSGCRWDGALISTTKLNGAVFDKQALTTAVDWRRREDSESLSGSDDEQTVTKVRLFDLAAARRILDEKARSARESGLRTLFQRLTIPERLLVYRLVFMSARKLRNEGLVEMINGPDIRALFKTHPAYSHILSLNNVELTNRLQDPPSRLYGLMILHILHGRGALPFNPALHSLVAMLLEPGIDVGSEESGSLVRSPPPLPADLYRWESQQIWSALRSHRAVDDIELAGLVVRAPSRMDALREAKQIVAAGLRMSPLSVLGLAIQYFTDLGQSLRPGNGDPEAKRFELGSVDLGDLLRGIGLNASMGRMPTLSDVTMVERMIRRVEH